MYHKYISWQDLSRQRDKFLRSRGLYKKHQKIDVALQARWEIVHINDERFTYPSDPHAINDESCVHSELYKPITDRDQQMDDHQVVQAEDCKRLQNDWRHDVHLSEKYYLYQDAFTEMHAEFEAM